MGGISAGMAIMGDAYFSAQNGTVTSAQALNDPYSNLVAIGYDDFIENPSLENTITDTHYDNPDRRGRHSVFIARLYTDYGFTPYGIACEEYTAVCIDENKIAHVYGEYPEYDDYVYFLQVNCFEPITPEVCEPDNPLTWERNFEAIKAVVMGATNYGEGYFDLNDWKTAGGTDYTWQNWAADDGELFIEENAAPIECDTTTGIDDLNNNFLNIYPNPASDNLVINGMEQDDVIQIINMQGEKVLEISAQALGSCMLNINHLPSATYLVQVISATSKLKAYYIQKI